MNLFIVKILAGLKIKKNYILHNFNCLNEYQSAVFCLNSVHGSYIWLSIILTSFLFKAK